MRVMLLVVNDMNIKRAMPACVCKGDVLAHTPWAIVLEHNVEPTLWHCSHIAPSEAQSSTNPGNVESVISIECRISVKYGTGTVSEHISCHMC